MIDWTKVEAFALREGIARETVKKWRQRGIAHKWRMDIIGRTGITAADMRAHDRAVKRRKAARMGGR